MAGQSVYRIDMRWREMYLNTGVAAAGWFPVEGILPRADLRRSAAQTKSGASWELVNAAWGSAPYASSGGFTFSAGVLTVPQDGLYQIDAAITFTAIAAGNNRGIQVTKNVTNTDTTYPGTLFKRETTGAATGGVGVSGAVALRKGDALRVQALGAQSANLGTNGYDTWCTVSYLGPA